MKEFKIINEVMPVIEMNFSEVKAALTETLTKYKNLIVTDETLTGCKATQKELAGVRTKIDTYRKDKKKAMSEPITAFENQCKELISLVEKAEQPIKDGIKVFDDAKRAEKRTIAERLIQEVIAEQGLNEKHGSKLNVIEKYCNLTAKESEVRTDLEQRAFVLLADQNREAELLDIIKDTIATENQRINAKMELKDFQRLIDRGMQTKDILAEIKQKAEGIFRAENPPKVEPVIEPVTEVIEPVAEPVEPPIEMPFAEIEEPTYFATYRITGTHAQLKGVSEYLKANKITYSVQDQGEV